MATLAAHPGSTEETQQSASNAPSISPTSVEIYQCIRDVEQRTWWSLINTVAVVLLLTATIVCLTLPTLVRVNIMHPFGGADLSLAVQGLVALVLLFNIFAARQHFQLRKLCEQIKESLRAVGK